MPVIPSVMVLYTNDAVEVRYSDGSRLQLSPCGSSMFHQNPTSSVRHPLAGVEGAQKWTQFVTSSHRAKVLQALDFRNRFAQRPFLCSTLIPPEDIVSLYAKIDKIAWPKTPKDTSIEVFEDGSRRAVSSDEYASLVLSPHGQDFTVCYLSHISQDAKHCRDQTQQAELLPDTSFGCQGERIVEEERHGDAFQQHTVKHSRGDHGETGGNPSSVTPEDHKLTESLSQTSVQEYNSAAALNSNGNNGCAGGVEFPSNGTEDVSGVILSDGTVSTPGRTMQQDDFHMSGLPSVHHDISSISRVSTPDGLRGMVDCDVTLPQNSEIAVNQPSPADILHSSPLSLANTQSHTKLKDVTMDKPYIANKSDSNERNDHESGTVGSNLSGEKQLGAKNSDSFLENKLGPTGNRKTQLESTALSPKADSTACPTLDCSQEQASHKTKSKVPFHDYAREHWPSAQTEEGRMHTELQRQSRVLQADFTERKDHQIRGKGAGSKSGTSGKKIQETWSATRQHYTWVTQHFSCSNCPAAWRHPLRMLQQVDPSDSVLKCNLSVSTTIIKGSPRQATLGSDSCVYSCVASPLPLACPFQHLHIWQPHHHEPDDDDQSAGLGQFKQGQFHVIMMEGVVYRFVQLGDMKMVEIYPGDGSVFVSQGMTAHFFSHILWKDGKLVEKTYSVKMLPPNIHKLPYSVEKLIKRGHRLLTGSIQSNRFAEKEELPCWKHAPVHVVEPLSATVLEECTVPGYGRFTAYFNGRIRIVFEDRTALDMVSDFSQRLKSCWKHSDYSEHSCTQNLTTLKVTGFDQQMNGHHCRLLLPTGKYVNVEVYQPGCYRRYIEIAKEWIGWVQSSPKERRQFYQHKQVGQNAQRSAEAELKKIECFNYIVDHSSITTNISTGEDQPSVSSVTQVPPAVLQQPPHNLQPVPACSHHLSQDLSVTTQYSPVTQTATQNSCVYGHTTGHATSQQVSSRELSKGMELVQGFNSVREALLRTSQMIKDIDDIVKDHKKTT